MSGRTVRIALRAGALAVWCFALGAQAAQAQVLIMAPHPDDEALFASGIIYQARLSGQTVKVVVATNGDCGILTIGQVRQQESVAAMGVLGLAPDDVIFLGYPDCGLYRLYHDYASAQSRYTSVAGFTHTYASEGLGRMDYHSYIHGAPATYNGFSLAEDSTTLLHNYRPQDVYVTSAYDDHTDHYTLNLFVGDALLALLRSDATFQPTLHDAIVHEPCELCDETYHWPMPIFTPTVPFPMPPQLGTTPLGWSDIESVEVPAPLQSTIETNNPKWQAIARYASQGPAAWLESFVKRNEIFWTWDLWANRALHATASASSAMTTASGMSTVERLNDGSVVGTPRALPESEGKGEWVSAGERAGAWAKLTWPTAQTLTRIVLHDRPDPAENISSGTLTFSDGSSIPVGALPASGVGLSVTFAQKTITWVRFTVAAATGIATGLAELEAYGPAVSKLQWQAPGFNTPPVIVSGPTATPSTINDGSTSTLTASGFDADSDLLEYTWTPSAGQVQGTGASVLFIPPPVTVTTSFRIDVIVNDGRGGTVTSWVTVSVTPTDTSPEASGDVAIDFGPAFGLWLVMNPTGPTPRWSQLHTRSPTHLAVGDLDGNGRADLIVDFPGSGVWIWFNNLTWIRLSPLDVSDMTVGDFDGNGVADVALSFPGYGVYVWMNNATWVQLHGLAGSGMAAGNLDNDPGHRDELIVNFPGRGVWVWTNNSTWVQLHSLNATHIVTGDFDGNGRADVALDFAGYGLWTWMNNATWVQRHRLNSLASTTGNLDGDAGGRADLVVNFAGAGVWALMNNTTWVQIHPLNATQMTTLDLDGDGRADLILTFPGAGIWVWLNNTRWIQLHTSNAEEMVAGQIDTN